MATETTVTEDRCNCRRWSWKTPNRDDVKSPPFTIQNMKCRLEFYKGRAYDCDYRLYLLSDCKPDDPLDLSVQLIIGTITVSQGRTTYGSACEMIIWKGHIREISKVVPDCDRRDFLFKVIVHDSTPTDDNQGHKSVQTPLYLDPKFELEKLSEDFAKLLNGDDSTCDVEVVCGDRIWKVHRNLLGCRSEVFRAMLQTDMLEGKNGRIEVRDTETGLFEQLLQHLYTGILPNLTVETAVGLYEMGDKYNVKGLKRQCASFLEENLALDNACGILSLADRHSDQDLKEIAAEYVLEQKIPLKEDHWSSFCSDYPVLALEVLNRFCKLQETSLGCFRLAESFRKPNN